MALRMGTSLLPWEPLEQASLQTGQPPQHSDHAHQTPRSRTPRGTLGAGGSEEGDFCVLAMTYVWSSQRHVTRISRPWRGAPRSFSSAHAPLRFLRSRRRRRAPSAQTCPVSTAGWTRRVHFVREGAGGGGGRWGPAPGVPCHARRAGRNQDMRRARAERGAGRWAHRRRPARRSPSRLRARAAPSPRLRGGLGEISHSVGCRSR
jgi:hypothetical protein